MSLNQGKYKPSVCAIDEVDDRSLKHDEMLQHQQHQHEQRQVQIEGSETAPLTTNQHKTSVYDDLSSSDIESQKRKEGIAIVSSGGSGGVSGGGGDSGKSGASGGSGNSSVNGLRGRLSLDALVSSTRRRRILYISTACLFALLLIVIVLLAAFWPNVPFYMKAELCLQPECVEASQQVLLWANTTHDPCANTYEWACGNFEQDYADHEYFVIKRGEWNYKTYNEYQELNELNRFISMLPTSGTSYSVEFMITSLYRSCREIDTLDKSQADFVLQKAMKSVDGWQASRDGVRLLDWEYRKALVHLHAIYGIFPYYKVNVENRFNKPHDYIITLDEGEIGLPDAYFYNIDSNDEIVRSYKLLLRDFAINMGIVSREADLFADEIFHYEKRIVNHIESVRSAGVVDGLDKPHKTNEIKTLAELKTIAPSLPIYESLKAIFPHTKISEETEVLVRNVQILHEMSTVLSTSDKKPINNFIIWSLVRHLLPHLSKEYRNLMENFDRAIYGRMATYPRWLVCARTVRDWLPFAVDALQQSSGSIRMKEEDSINSRIKTVSKDVSQRKDRSDQFLELLYQSVRNQLQISVMKAEWIEPEMQQFLHEKLTEMRLQIGIPEEAVTNGSYIKDYYNELLLNNLYFVEYLGSIWSFSKSRMEDKLKARNIVDTIISEMYTQESPKAISYSNILNMLIISREISATHYYDYKFPISINFARIGADILEVLIEAISTFVEQFNADHSFNVSDSLMGRRFELAKVDASCVLSSTEVENDDDKDNLQHSEHALKSFHVTLSAAKIAARALSTFTEAIDSAQSVNGMSLADPSNTYGNLGLKDRRRIPGLRSFNENELFALAYMQKHCSTPIADKDYARIKPHVERELAERYLFNATWNHIQFLPRASSCPVPDVRCPNIL